MKRYKIGWYIIIVLIGFTSCKNREGKPKSVAQEVSNGYYQEAYRPQFHFSPQEKWMNDPNGLVYYQGIYHLFYQYYPDDIVWGPMHWGHATSKDMIHWQHKPIALYPDENGYIFSGSAVVDKENTSGFGTRENPPLVAIFTYHDAKGNEEGQNDFQTQGIAYSLDNGGTWTTYEGNPVVKNNGIRDFRDPKVFWNRITHSWTMLLVAGNHLQIWNSEDLKNWDKLSEFGRGQGAHGGVWECPDMFPLSVEGTDREKWVLLISINPGAPNGGSGTQYFIGDFDGKTFSSDQKEPRWIDWGTDNYAGVTYNNIPHGDRIFIGWMSNWSYAQNTPTEKWRSAMTLPRKLSLRKIGDTYELINYPLDGLDKLIDEGTPKDVKVERDTSKSIAIEYEGQAEIRFATHERNFAFSFKNGLDEVLVLSMNGEKKVFCLDRTKSGKIGFQKDFGSKLQKMPIPNLPEGELEFRLLMDRSSIEIFINKGQYVMTAQIFPNEPYTKLELKNESNTEQRFKDFRVSKVKGIW